ncbi:hypothetical protein ACFL59_10165 [Planctomycetota bacterium]
MPTVADILKRIERITKDLEHVRGFQDKWREQRERFPKIYDGIVEQERAFLRKIDELRNLGVNASDAVLQKADSPSGDKSGEEPRPLLTPAIEGSNESGRRKKESSDDNRAAEEEIGDKLRNRKGSAKNKNSAKNKSAANQPKTAEATQKG